MNSQYVRCVDNNGLPASLEKGCVYRVVADRRGEAHGLIRIVDESGEAYLYPRSRFVDAEPATTRNGGVGNGRRRPAGRSPSNSVVTRAALDRMGIEELAALIDEARDVARRKLDELSKAI